MSCGDNEFGVSLSHWDSFELMGELINFFPEEIFDMIFAYPPYFLSNEVVTCYAGKIVKVD